MKKRLLNISILVILVLSIASIFVPQHVEASPIKDGNAVYIQTDDTFIRVEPHTLTSSGWVTVQFTSAKFSGDVDISFGFTGSDDVEITQAQDAKDAKWQQSEKNLSSDIRSYAGTDKWQSKQIGQSVVKNSFYTARFWVEIPIRLSNDPLVGKYNVAVKPHGMTVDAAIKSGNFAILDPWYNASWDYRKSVTVSDASANYQTKVLIGKTSAAVGEDVDCNGHVEDDFDDLRFTGADEVTLLDYWIESIVDSGGTKLATVWVENNAVPDTTLYMYYGNAGAAAVSSGADTFIDFEDFEWGNDGDPIDDNGGSVTWTIQAGDVDVSTTHDIGDVSGYFGTRAMKVFDGGSPSFPVSPSDNIAVRFEVYKEDAASVTMVHGDGTSVVQSRFYTDEKLQYYIAAYNDTGSSGTAGQWELSEYNDFDWTGATYDWYWNDVQVGNDLGDRTSGSYQDYWRFIVGSGNVWVDNVIVRKWASTEQTFSAFGAETPRPTTPTVTTSAATSVEETTATLNGEITDIGSGNATVRGFEYDTDSGAPYANDWHENGVFGAGVFDSGANVTGLTKGELYYFRAYATNGDGTGYGAEQTFLTKPDEPTAFVATASSDTQIGLTWTKGTGAQKTYIRGKKDAYPVDRADGDLVYNDTGVSTTHAGLSSGEHWYYRAWSYATEGALEQYSDNYDEADDTTWVPPTVTTNECTGFTANSAIVNGTIDNIGGTSVTQFGFDYGLTGAYGSSVTVTKALSNGDEFKYNLINLTPATVYHYRAKAYGEGWGYGTDHVFATEGSPVRYEYLNTGQDGDSLHIYQNNWAYMQFTTGTVAHTVTSINIYVKRVLSPGDITVSIKHASGGLPTGNDLVVGTLDGDAISTAYVMYQVEVTETTLEASQQYAIVVRAIDGDGSNYVLWGVDSGGGLADAVYGTSTDGGATFSNDSPKDALFEIWGNPEIDVISAKVFTDYKEDGDWLIAILYKNLYEPYYSDKENVKKYFAIQLVDSSNNVKSQVSCPEWDYKPASIYLNATQVTALTWGGTYYVRLQGLFTGTPYTEYALLSTDWVGSDLTVLDDWALTSADLMGDYYDTTMTTYVADRGKVLNATGGVILANCVTGLNTCRPGLFQIYSGLNVNPIGGSTSAGAGESATSAQEMLGTYVYSQLSNAGNVFGVDGKTFGGWILIIFMVVVMAFGLPSGHSTAANVLAIPIFFMGLGLRLFDWASGAVMVALMLFLLWYNIWFKHG